MHHLFLYCQSSELLMFRATQYTAKGHIRSHISSNYWKSHGKILTVFLKTLPRTKHSTGMLYRTRNFFKISLFCFFLFFFFFFWFILFPFIFSQPSIFCLHTRRTLKRTCANTKSISPYFYIMPAVHKNRYKLIRYIKLLHIHDQYSYRSRNGSKPYKEIGTRTLIVLLKRAVYMIGGSKMTIIFLPKKSRMPEIPLSKVQSTLKCEFCWSEVLRGKTCFPFLQKDDKRNELQGLEQTTEHMAVMKPNVSS